MTRAWMRWIVVACAGVPLAAQAVEDRGRLPDARVGQAYAYGVVTRGLVEPLVFAWTGEIPGVRSEGAWITGTPEREGEYVVGLKVIDALDQVLETSYEVEVRPAIAPLELLTSQLPTFVVGEDVDFVLGARGGEGAYRWSIEGTLPDGLAIEDGEGGSGCSIVGRPTEVGDIALDVVLADSVTVLPQREIVGRVAPPPAPALDCAVDALPGAYLGVPYQARLHALGGKPPYRWSLGADQEPPDWLHLDGASGVLSGTPDRIGQHRLLVEASDAPGSRVACELPLDVVLPAQYTGPSIVPGAPMVALIGRELEMTFQATGSVGRPAWSFAWDDAPGWAELAPRGDDLVLSGVPDQRGLHHLELSVRDLAGEEPDAQELGASGSVSISIEIGELLPGPTPARLLTEVLPPAVVGKRYEVPLRLDGGPATVRCSGEPEGLSVSADGVIAGKPDEAGDHKLSLQLDSADGSSISATLVLEVIEVERPLSAGPPVVASVVPGSELSLPLPVSGGARPYDVGRAALPEGVELGDDGLSGTLSAPGDYQIEIPVRDATGAAITARLALIVPEIPSPGRWMAATILLGVLLGSLLWREHRRSAAYAGKRDALASRVRRLEQQLAMRRRKGGKRRPDARG